MIFLKLQAEKNSADKFICYDCNNWLINWFSLQNVNETTERDTPPKNSQQQHTSTVASAPHANMEKKENTDIENEENIVPDINRINDDCNPVLLAKLKQQTFKFTKKLVKRKVNLFYHYN